MYQPGGAMFAFGGPSTVRLPAPFVKLSHMKRWSWSTLCVSEPMRTSET